MNKLLILLFAGVALPVWASPPASTPAGQERGRSGEVREQPARESSSRGSPGRGSEKNSDKSSDSESLLPAFTSAETDGLVRRVLEEYFGLSAPETHEAYNQRALPPGLQRKLDRGGSLPPGWQKKLARGEVMPVDIYRQGVRLPNHYGRQHQQDETELLLLGDKIVRVVQGQGTILDVIDITSAILQPR